MKFFFIFLFFFFLINIAHAQTDCPIGLVNDPAPGKCGAYTDKDKNDLCDLSEIEVPAKDVESGSAKKLSEAEFKQKTVAEISDIYDIDAAAYARELSLYLKKTVNINDSMAVLHDENALCATVAANIAVKIKQNSKSAQEKPITPKYDFFIILFVLTSAYLLSYILAIKKKISFLAQQRFWNILLAIFFLVSGLSGLFLVLRINYGLAIAWPFNLLWLHVETGIAMAVISIFHLVWHWRYYACMIKRKKKEIN